jgi:hypothetical protein
MRGTQVEARGAPSQRVEGEGNGTQLALTGRVAYRVSGGRGNRVGIMPSLPHMAVGAAHMSSLRIAQVCRNGTIVL